MNMVHKMARAKGKVALQRRDSDELVLIAPGKLTYDPAVANGLSFDNWVFAGGDPSMAWPERERQMVKMALAYIAAQIP